jgi:ribosomal protein S18 acetylase RimI-like enzyme
MHSKGIGKQLIYAIPDYAPTTKIIVHTRTVNAPAIAFYTKLGFIPSSAPSYYPELDHILVGFELHINQ